MSIIQKLHNWFTKSNEPSKEPSKEELKQKIQLLEEKLANTEACHKELLELKFKYKFLLKDHSLMEDRYKAFSHLLCLPFAIRHNMIADYKRSYIEAVNYIGGTHVFKS